jgi:hypothetical protein
MSAPPWGLQGSLLVNGRQGMINNVLYNKGSKESEFGDKLMQQQISTALAIV